MKTYTKLFVFPLVCSLIMTLGLLSCSSDDGEDSEGEVPTLPTPKYENDAVKYVASDDEAAISSIELTVDGQYIIVENSSSILPLRTTEKRIRSIITDGLHLTKAISARSSSASSGGIIYGKFEKISDTEYFLEGYGTIVIKGSSNSTTSIIVTPLNGESTTISTVPVSEYKDSALTKAISRKWNIDEIEIEIKIINKLIYSGKKAANKFWELYTEADQALAKLGGYTPTVYDYSFTPEEIIFSRSGTYLAGWTSNIYGLATWYWVNESKRTIHFSWDYDNQTASINGVSGDAKVSFNGNTLKIYESNSTTEEGITLTAATTYYCSLP